MVGSYVDLVQLLSMLEGMFDSAHHACSKSTELWIVRATDHMLNSHSLAKFAKGALASYNPRSDLNIMRIPCFANISFSMKTISIGLSKWEMVHECHFAVEVSD